ncbi:UTP-glucose-1-phosphate uridylyltransferase [Paraburkholderia sp. UCT70]|uniref:hypothetical protein n=1 Tax=Paraburkholderia sp. UCT70 TaxID=2991068 RepID=UPI003D1BCCE0
MIFVTGRSKRVIENHVDKSNEIGAELEARGKKALWGPRSASNLLMSAVLCHQADALGFAHAKRAIPRNVVNTSDPLSQSKMLSDRNPPARGAVWPELHSSSPP